MLRLIERFLPHVCAPPPDEDDDMKLARLDAKLEDQDIRLALTKELVRTQETAAARLIAALNRDREKPR
mgnify:CR=1 FL=1